MRLASRHHAGDMASALRRVMCRMTAGSGVLVLLGLGMHSLRPPVMPGPEQMARQLHRQLPVNLEEGIVRVAVRPAGDRAFILHYTIAPGMEWAADAEQFVQAWQPRLDRDFCESPLFAPLRARRSSVSFVFMHTGSPRPYAVVTSMQPWCPGGVPATAPQ